MPEIVKMNAAHVAKIAEIEKVSFKTPWSAQMIADELKNPLANYFVVEKDGQVLAYMGYYRILDEAHITNIAVKPDEKRKGYGKALLSFVLNEMKENGVQRVTLEVNEKNIAAIRLYESFGFLTAGRRKKYYEGVDDALIYWLNTGE